MKRIDINKIRQLIPNSEFISLAFCFLCLYLMHCCYSDGFQRGYMKGLTESKIIQSSSQITYGDKNVKNNYIIAHK